MNKTICFISVVVFFLASLYIGGTVFYFVSKTSSETVDERLDQLIEETVNTTSAETTVLTMTTTLTTTIKNGLTEQMFEIKAASMQTSQFVSSLLNLTGNFEMERFSESCHGGASFDYLLLIIAQSRCLDFPAVQTFLYIGTGFYDAFDFLKAVNKHPIKNSQIHGQCTNYFH